MILRLPSHLSLRTWPRLLAAIRAANPHLEIAKHGADLEVGDRKRGRPAKVVKVKYTSDKARRAMNRKRK